MRKVPPLSWPLAIVFAAAKARGDDKVEDALISAMKRLQDDVLQYRNEVERAYTERCWSRTLNTCQKNNFNECSSRYPNQTCPSAKYTVVTECGTGDMCNGLFDWSVSTVRLPLALANGPENNPTDTDVRRNYVPWCAGVYVFKSESYLSILQGFFSHHSRFFCWFRS
mmetsp:Transcript_39498/g.118569  ORF Transcript_39498/g.118569 Transcript_39498/m.118569 type:complete len:168 (-) Transcript_39498:1689-2192(-)